MEVKTIMETFKIFIMNLKRIYCKQNNIWL
jgi:hypothetical protein